MTAQVDRLTTLDDFRDIPWPESNGQPETVDDAPANTWRPENLILLAENPPAPPTIGGLLYPAKRTVLSGETESMKTWLALILCKAEIDIGNPVGWVDLDAMGPGALLERLQLLGLTDQQIADQFLYYEPAEMLTTEKTAQVAETIAERRIRLFVIDAFNPILALHGLDPNAVTDIETFWRHIADPICRAGAAPVLLDHVVKNADNRGKYSTGSERKASGATVHIGFRLLEPLTKGGRGRSLLSVHKDRPGYLPRPTIGRLVITSQDDEITFEIEPDKSHDPEGGFRPLGYMEKISRALETHPEPATKKWIEETVDGKANYIRDGVLHLIEDGYVTATKGERGAILHTSIRPFREADAPTPTTSSRPRPDLVPDLRSVSSSDLVPAPPYGGAGRGQRDRPPTTSSAPRPRPDETIHEYDHPPIPIEELQALEPEPDDAQLEWWKT